MASEPVPLDVVPELGVQVEAGYVLPQGRHFLLAGPEQGPALCAAILEALAPHRIAEGAYRLENEWHHLVARP